MSLMIGDNTVVTIHYTLTNNDGEVIDSSEGAEPLAYLHGAENIIPGLEKALVGKAAGAKAQVSIEPADAYGELQPELVQQVPVEAFQGVEQIEPGMAFEAQDEQGNARRVVVRAVEDQLVIVDANHPLAGMTLVFAGTVRDVRQATQAEINQGGPQ